MRPALRQVLGELVACYGEQALDRGLLVWPSNDYLVTRTGLSERAIRRCIAQLGELELLVPVDSPNRKRFAVKGRDGAIIDAFGFDLAPLHGRRGEFEAQVERMRAQAETNKRFFDRITVARKACEEAIRSFAEYFPTFNIAMMHETFTMLSELTPLRSAASVGTPIVERWEQLRDTLETAFEMACTEKEESANAGPSDRHKEQNNGPSSETCQPSGVMRGEAEDPDITPELVLRACPAVKSYASRLQDDRDIEEIGGFLRGSIGAHQSAWIEAVGAIGKVRAAIAVILVLQMHEDDVNSGRNKITNPGGLFRFICRKVKEGEYSLRLELQQLARKRMT